MYVFIHLYQLKIFVYERLCVCVYVHILIQPLNHREDATQNQFLSWENLVWIQSLPSPRLLAEPRLKNLVRPTIYP